MSTGTAIKERPILFTPAMAQAVYEGRKTQTRRVMKPQPVVGRYGPRHKEKPNGIIGPLEGSLGGGNYHIWPNPSHHVPLLADAQWQIERYCPYGVPGDRLYCRETHAYSVDGKGQCCIVYKGDGSARYLLADENGEGDFCGVGRVCRHPEPPTHWRPNIHMPRWACRSVLEVASVRVERVESITEEDAIAEGFEGRKTRATLNGVEGDYIVGAARDEFLDTFYRINKRAPEGSNPWVWVIAFRRINP